MSTIDRIIEVNRKGDEYLETQHERNPMLRLMALIVYPFVVAYVTFAMWKQN